MSGLVHSEEELDDDDGNESPVTMQSYFLQLTGSKLF